MTPKWSIIGPVAILVLVVLVLVAYSTFNPRTMETPLVAPPAAVTTSTQAASQPIAPNGDIDNTANAFLQDIGAEQAVVDQADADASLYTTDSQEINNISQSYNDSDF